VVEIDNETRAQLRFGDDRQGRQPEAGAAFTATYRVGNGKAGNVGAETISHVVYEDVLSGVNLQPRNPLPAAGGVDPETLAEVKRFAPHAFRTELRRAVTADDYVAIVMRDFPEQVQQAAARLRWNGSWHEVVVVVDPRDQAQANADLLSEIERHLQAYRRIGHDLTVRRAQYVPLDIEMTVCVLPNYLRGHVKGALLDRFSDRRLPNGTLGFFHPDNLSFGEAVRLSRLVAAAQAVSGVESVSVTKLERLHAGPNGELASGLLSLGPLEVARLDNDPSFPEHGRIRFEMGGGR
jgi:predicted phage baseplate assembly protein